MIANSFEMNFNPRGNTQAAFGAAVNNGIIQKIIKNEMAIVQHEFQFITEIF